MADRISFMAFLGFPDLFPDSRTIWLFRERMVKTEKDKIVWAELQRQLDSMGLQVRRGTIQDATFIEADRDLSKNHAVMRLKLAAAEMAPARKRGINIITDTSYIKSMCLAPSIH